jgi:hypothetical protein
MKWVEKGMSGYYQLTPKETAQKNLEKFYVKNYHFWIHKFYASKGAGRDFYLKMAFAFPYDYSKIDHGID